ncbi:hypothetical protein GCM10007100_25500 [Roseibacillus persicicus]|uniref:Uncharacterized protein n=1 Tax=Roseibacillus persicicus TaxID=454148 RepID=A0A918TQI5_9BACT|nr:hypothetical protein GCM10007100_25500 [Roseibacillus persicicus]
MATLNFAADVSDFFLRKPIREALVGVFEAFWWFLAIIGEVGTRFCLTGLLGIRQELVVESWNDSQVAGVSGWGVDGREFGARNIGATGLFAVG